MDMNFKTLKTSETGQKFAELEKKSKQAQKEAKDFSKKYGFSKYRGGYWCVFGGISSCLDFEETPDSKIWGKGAEKGEFMPKRNIKIGKEIFKEIESLTTVSYRDVNECIGVDEHFGHIGFSFKNDKYYVFTVPEKWNAKIPEDCVEITSSEYRKLSDNK